MAIAHTVLIIHDAIYSHLSSSQFELGYKGRVTTRLACSRQIILIEWERGIAMYSALWKARIWLAGGQIPVSHWSKGEQMNGCYLDRALISHTYLNPEPGLHVQCSMFKWRLITQIRCVIDILYPQVTTTQILSGSFCFIKLSHWAETAKIHSWLKEGGSDSGPVQQPEPDTEYDKKCPAVHLASFWAC